MSLEIQIGDPPLDGRYVVWTPCRALQVREWCEPSIQTWQGGRWHHGEPVHCWIGPLPVVNTKTGEIAEHHLVNRTLSKLAERLAGTEYDL